MPCLSCKILKFLFRISLMSVGHACGNYFIRGSSKMSAPWASSNLSSGVISFWMYKECVGTMSLYGGILQGLQKQIHFGPYSSNSYNLFSNSCSRRSFSRSISQLRFFFSFISSYLRSTFCIRVAPCGWSWASFHILSDNV